MINSDTLKLLIQYKFLNKRLKANLAEKNPVDFISTTSSYEWGLHE